MSEENKDYAAGAEEDYEEESVTDVFEKFKEQLEEEEENAGEETGFRLYPEDSKPHSLTIETNIYGEYEAYVAGEYGESIIPEEEEEPFISIFDILDAPRELPEPVELSLEHLKQIANELGLIRLCWPDINKDITFESRSNFPDSYLKNTNKEKLLLFYAENLRQQFHYKYPNRKPLFVAADNECGQQKMVCTTLRPTTLPHTEIEQWQDCAAFVGDHLIYEPLEAPTLINIMDDYAVGIPLNQGSNYDGLALFNIVVLQQIALKGKLQKPLHNDKLEDISNMARKIDKFKHP